MFRYFVVITFILALTLSVAAQATPYANPAPAESSPPRLTGIVLEPAVRHRLRMLWQSPGTTAPASDITPRLRHVLQRLNHALSIAPDDLWVNLNPEQPDRLMSPALAVSPIGEELLAQDLRLKQTLSQLLHPDTPTGHR
jgi:hypothetical protein